jgi:hypothetical protein
MEPCDTFVGAMNNKGFGRPNQSSTLTAMVGFGGKRSNGDIK